MKKTIKIQGIIFYFIFCNLIYAQNGETFFQKGYSYENAPIPDTVQAIANYEQALTFKLDKKIQDVIIWRLLYLYKNQYDHLLAIKKILELPNINEKNKILNKIYSSLALKWNFSKFVTKKIESLLFSLYDDNKNIYEEHAIFLLSNYKEHHLLKKFIMYSFLHYDKVPELIRIMEDLGDESIQKIELYLYAKNITIAHNLLLKKASSGEFSQNNEDYAKILYLLGRVYREKKKYELAISCFRLAASYAKEDRDRMLSLAAYSLFQIHLPEQALSLLKNIKIKKYDESYFLKLLLQIEIEQNTASMEEILALKDYIAKQPSSMIFKRLLQFIKTYEKKKGKSR